MGPIIPDLHADAVTHAVADFADVDAACGSDEAAAVIGLVMLPEAFIKLPVGPNINAPSLPHITLMLPLALIIAPIAQVDRVAPFKLA